jgi:hypothetical protein
MLKKIFSLVLLMSFLFQQISFAQMAMELKLAGAFVKPQSNLATDKFRPVHMRFFSYDSLNNDFKVILDKGDLKNLKGTELDNVSKELMNYFLVGVTLNNDAFWVNLRPDSENEIIDNLLAKTDVGKIMLEADLELKKDTASFTSPQTTEGKAYWNKLYKKAEELFGSDQITIPTLTRPWIVPDEVIVRENKDSAYIYKASLKIMLEQDYLKNSVNYSFSDPRQKELNEYSSQLVRELILPKLTKEINTSKKYAQLRQVFFSLVLSRWFKSRFQGKAGKYASLINKGNLTNLTSKTAWSASTYFKGYQESFNKGEYNIKEPVYTPSGQVIRSYFSGGADLTGKALKFDGVSSSLGFGVLPGTKDILDKLAGNQNMVLVGPNLTAASPVGEDASFSIVDMNNAFQVFRRRLNQLPVSLGQSRMRPGQGLTSAVSTQATEDALQSFSNVLEGVDAVEPNEISRILDFLRNYQEQLKGDLEPTSPMNRYLWLIRDADDAIDKTIKKLEGKSAASRGGASSALLNNDSIEEREKIWQPDEIDAAIAQAEKTNVNGANTNDDYRAIVCLADITGMDKKQFQRAENLLTHLLEGKNVHDLLRKIAGKSLTMVRSNHSQFSPAQPVEQKGAVIGFLREDESPANIERLIEIFGGLLEEVKYLKNVQFETNLALGMLGSIGGMNRDQFFRVVEIIQPYLIRSSSNYYKTAVGALRDLFVWYYPVREPKNRELFDGLNKILENIPKVNGEEGPERDEAFTKGLVLVTATLRKHFDLYEAEGQFFTTGMDLKPMTSPVIYPNLARDAVTYYVTYLSWGVKLSGEQKAQKVNIAELQVLLNKAVERLATFVHGEFINGAIPIKNTKDGGIDYREQILVFMKAADEIVNRPNYWWVKNSIGQAAYHMRLIEEAQTAAASPVEDNEALKLLSGYVRDFKDAFNRCMREISQSVIGTTSSGGSVGLVMNGSIIDVSLGAMRISVDELGNLELKNVPKDRISTYLTTLGSLEKEVESAAKNDSVRRKDYLRVQAFVSECIDKLTGIQKVTSGPQTGSSSPMADKKGGIDFRDRALQIKYEALGSFSKIDLTRLTVNPALAKMNLDAEWKQISTAVGNGYVISGQRIEEFVLACNQKGELDARADELLCFLADYCRLLEKECCSTPKEVMESMVIVETKLQG